MYIYIYIFACRAHTCINTDSITPRIANPCHARNKTASIHAYKNVILAAGEGSGPGGESGGVSSGVGAGVGACK